MVSSINFFGALSIFSPSSAVSVLILESIALVSCHGLNWFEIHPANAPFLSAH